MYARLVQATIKPKRLAEFKDAVTSHDLPAIRSLPGFVDDIEMYLENKFVSITFWQTEKDAEQYTCELFPQIAARSAPLVSDTGLRAQVYKIERDTIHEAKIEAVKKMESTAVRAFAAVA